MWKISEYERQRINYVFFNFHSHYYIFLPSQSHHHFISIIFSLKYFFREAISSLSVYLSPHPCANIAISSASHSPNCSRFLGFSIFNWIYSFRKLSSCLIIKCFILRLILGIVPVAALVYISCLVIILLVIQILA